MPLDDGRMTETWCGSNIGRGEEDLLHWWTHNCFVNYTHATGNTTTVIKIRDYLSSQELHGVISKNIGPLITLFMCTHILPLLIHVVALPNANRHKKLEVAWNPLNASKTRAPSCSHNCLMVTSTLRPHVAFPNAKSILHPNTATSRNVNIKIPIEAAKNLLSFCHWLMA
jgi:hypothetical protein